MVAVAVLLTANAIVCAAIRLARAARRRILPLRVLCAHLAHLGFLFVLAAHFVGSCWGFRSDGHPAFRGQRFSVPQRPGWSIGVDRVAVELAPQGYPKAMEASLFVAAGKDVIATGLARANHPVVVGGVAIYLTNVDRTLRGWNLGNPQGPPIFAEVGRFAAVPGGALLLSDWTTAPGGALAVRVVWAPENGPAMEDWLAPSPGQTLSLPHGPTLVWGELAVDTLATFDVRYDPGIRLALAGGALLSVSLLPLLWPRRRQDVPRAPEPHTQNSFEATADGAS
jgi:hypothetical protein